MADFKLQSGQKIVLIGDSITDCGRRDQFPPLGNGYVSIAANLVTAKYPERRIEWVNKGIGGDVVQGLVERWTKDVIEEKPDWVSVAIGINNVVRDQASNRGLDECLVDFQDSYRRIFNRTWEETSADIIMFEIFYLSGENSLRRELKLKPYNDIIHRLAVENKALLVPVNVAFKRAASKRTGGSWTTGDGVHPLLGGHTLIALTFLKTLRW